MGGSIKYNKLVRDYIPRIILNNGKEIETKILNEEEYIEALELKLKEEVEEYIESKDIEELADVAEVLDFLVYSLGYNKDTFNAIRNRKNREKGKFEKKIFLVQVSESNQ